MLPSLKTYSPALLFLLACTQGPEKAIDPVWGKQACDHCMMLLSEPRSSAQVVLIDGTRRFFDDVGCLVEWLKSTHTSAVSAWVRSPHGNTWIDARAAHYSTGQHTPMDYGFLPADKGLSFEQLDSAVRERSASRTGTH
jgi:copper chaperone NosL